MLRTVPTKRRQAQDARGGGAGKSGTGGTSHRQLSRGSLTAALPAPPTAPAPTIGKRTFACKDLLLQPILRPARDRMTLNTPLRRPGHASASRPGWCRLRRVAADEAGLRSRHGSGLPPDPPAAGGLARDGPVLVLRAGRSAFRRPIRRRRRRAGEIVRHVGARTQRWRRSRPARLGIPAFSRGRPGASWRAAPRSAPSLGAAAPVTHPTFAAKRGGRKRRRPENTSCAGGMRSGAATAFPQAS